MDEKPKGKSFQESMREAAASQAELVQKAAHAQAEAMQKAAVAQAQAMGTAMGTAATTHARVVFSDIWTAIRTDRKCQLLLAFLVFSLIFWDAPYISFLLYPFKLFVTVIHEACHALAARLTGGQVAYIQIAPDESGVTGSMGGIRPIVVMAGYLGTSIFGGLLIWWGRNPEMARTVLHTIGVVILALTVFYGGGGWFSVVSMLLIGSAILFISRKASPQICHMFLLMLAVMTTLEAINSIKDLFLISVMSDGATDARTMQELSGVPAAVWSILWGIVSVIVLFYSFWLSYRPAKPSPPAGNAPSAAGLQPDGSKGTSTTAGGNGEAK